MEQFFRQYIKENKCFYSMNKERIGYYYCDKSKFTKIDINKFPVLSFINIDYNEQFDFKGEELFFEKNNHYYFKIYFNEYSTVNWIIGKIFLQKYQLVFDCDNKVIGYYSTNNYKTNNDNPNNPKESKSQIQAQIGSSNKTIFMILIFIFAILLAIIIRKNICSNKHKSNIFIDKDPKEEMNPKRDKFGSGIELNEQI